MIKQSDRCKNITLLNTSCIWVEWDISECKTKKKRCSEMNESKDLCETKGAVENELGCVWIEDDNERIGKIKCITQVYMLYIEYEKNLFF
jgi:hypothetical protein